MKRGLVIFMLVILVVVINGCYYDVVEELYPANGSTACDTSNVTYSATVKPIIDQYCISCHSQALQQGGVILETHTDVVAYASTGQLLGSIKHDPAYAAMPQGGGKLTDCNILKIEKWIQTGTPNN